MTVYEKAIIRISEAPVQALIEKDATLKKLITHLGDIEIDIRPYYFKSLVRSIVGQQISFPAAEAVFSRVVELTGHDFTVDKVAQLSDEALLDVGLSRAKVKYTRDLIRCIQSGELDLERLDSLDDQTVLKQLTQVKGIGKWTAEMYLIFTLRRPNILAVDDVALQRVVEWLYQVDRDSRKRVLKEKKALWSPYLSYASFYLWETLSLDLLKYRDLDEAIENRNL
ncbi:DNA-3-methyladenine glycosylase 2 family protein [Staphylococcus massiliensis]|uniref:DNA-3-methyladenine glycosylase family protein n=1 Tax=Staphylococcus massiliensis TaxID=555791 RepID=UPI001EDD5AD3|nr:DNA-3-methyladenine glycosylase 2 family protein [Staphylococcus massiliensis]MCG3402282.1 DNA-3-methyladenine glycosylase 2 family protein [Staphylococcus massiliensis]